MAGVRESLEKMELRLGRQRPLFGLEPVARRDLDDRDPLRQSRADGLVRHGAAIVARMRRNNGSEA